MISIDLKDAYLSVPIFQEHRKYLRFIWEEMTYEFQCLPFGLSSAPRVFTKLMKPVMALLRQQGIRSVIFLDDILLMAESRLELEQWTQETLALLRLLGFRINWEKSQLVPTQVITYLGFIIDATRMKLTLPEEKVQQIITDCQSATNKGRVTVRELSKLIGRMSATMLAVLPAPLCYRGLQQLKNRAFATSQSYETTVTLTKEAIVELRWWTRMLRDWNGRPILPPTPDLIIETDASLLGWGAASAQGSTGGLWSEEERACHINALELMGGALATKTFAKGRQNIHIHLRMDNRTAMTYQSDGGNKVSNSITGGMRPMALVPTERDNIISRAPTRGAEHHSRHGIQDTTITSRVDAGKVNLPQGNADPGTMLNRSLRNQTQQPAGKVHKLAPRPIRNCNRRLPVVLAGRDWVRISPICTDWQMSAEGAPRTVYSGSDHPHMEHTTLVPSVTGPSGRVPIIAPNTKQTPNRPFQQSASSNSEQPTAVGRLESVRKTHIAEGISKQASELILSSWSKGTNTAYQSGWTKWASWCAERKVDPISGDVQHFIDFLAELYEQGLQHRSINTIRSAVSMTHKSVEGLPIGKHPLVTRLLKGIYNQRPPMPRYTSTWDVDVVTKHIVSMGRNEDLPLKHLSRKLVMLMALIKASRTSELRALDIRFRIYKPDGVIFKLTSLTKKRNPGLPLKELFFRAFPSDERLCIVHCLRQYEKITQELRSSELEEKPLFISYTRPHKPVTSQRLAHWIKDLLSEAGVDNIFKAHSVRGASTSAAMSRGVSLADILSTADWSKESTFRRFYYRESNPNGYVSKVLQGGTTTQAW